LKTSFLSAAARALIPRRDMEMVKMFLARMSGRKMSET
jgi:hypothetical protein